MKQKATSQIDKKAEHSDPEISGQTVFRMPSVSVVVNNLFADMID
jgi:hypothetical protein